MGRKLIWFFIISLLFSCNSYKQSSITSDVFLSHKIWKDNYQKYVYLVHDDESTMQLTDVEIAPDSTESTIKEISGNLIKYIPDTLTGYNSQEIRKKQRQVIDIYLTPNTENELEEGGSVTLTERDIHKVKLLSKKNTGALGAVAKFLGILLAIFILLILLTLVLLAASSGGSGGSSSNSDPQCYVATMVYGSTESEEVLALRHFRDTALMPTVLGRMFVKWYYANSPKFVQKHEDNQWLNSTIKSLLNMFVRVLKLMK